MRTKKENSNKTGVQGRDPNRSHKDTGDPKKQMTQRLRGPMTQAIFEYPRRGVKKTLFRMCNKYDNFDPKKYPKTFWCIINR